MRVHPPQRTNSRTAFKSLNLLATTALVGAPVCLAAPAVPILKIQGTQSEVRMPGGEGIITPRLMLQFMLYSLLEALEAEPDPPEEQSVAWEEDNLDEAAEMFILSYATAGVNTELSSEEASDALTTADDAEMAMQVQNLGLEASLEADLLETLNRLQTDLESLAP